MADSSIPTLKANLFDRLVALTAAGQSLEGVQITYGSPIPAPAREFVWLQGASGRQDAAALGHLRREETYTLAIRVSVLRAGNDQRSATERGFVIVAVIEELLRNNVTVDGAVRTAEVSGPFTLDERASETEREAVLDLSIYCTARL